MPFLFALPAVAIARISVGKLESETGETLTGAAGTLSMVLAILTVCVPVFIVYLTPKPIIATPTCTSQKVPYAAMVSWGSFIDLLPQGRSSCGAVPEVCLSDFQANRGSNNSSNVMVYDEIFAQAVGKDVRLFESGNMLNGRPHFFIGPAGALNLPNNVIITGCATETLIKGRPSIFSIQTISILDLSH